jgi:hypothetical protein
MAKVALSAAAYVSLKITDYWNCTNTANMIGINPNDNVNKRPHSATNK